MTIRKPHASEERAFAAGSSATYNRCTNLLTEFCGAEASGRTPKARYESAVFHVVERINQGDEPPQRDSLDEYSDSELEDITFLVGAAYLSEASEQEEEIQVTREDFIRRAVDTMKEDFGFCGSGRISTTAKTGLYATLSRYIRRLLRSEENVGYSEGSGPQGSLHFYAD